MAAFEPLTLTVPRDVAAALREAVDNGEYASLDAAFLDALTVWMRRHEDREEDLAWIKARVLRARLDPSPDLTEEELEARMEAFFAAADKAVDEAA